MFVWLLEVRLHISQPEYTVNEGDGTLHVCIVRDGQTTEPITLAIKTADDAALGV